jgi:hypothetical protein
MVAKAVQFLALVLTALALVPSGAHFFELPAKIALAQDQYFTVQSIYRGWSLFGIALIAALAADLALAYLLRDQRWPSLLVLAAAVLMGATLATFFMWIYPANQATANWTSVPANWEALRSQWEHTHALNAALTLAAFSAVSAAVIAARR